MTDNWLTPETAIGCRLPCGAVVVDVYRIWSNGCLTLKFNRAPAPDDGVCEADMRVFRANGSHRWGTLPNLIPPTPAQAGVFVTREGLLAAVREAIGDAPDTANDIADALGIPPDPPKVAPWEVAYEAWRMQQNAFTGSLEDAFEAGVMFAVGQIEAVAAPTCNSAKMEALLELRRRIMGDTK